MLPLIGSRAISAAEHCVPADFETRVAGAVALARARGLEIEWVTRRLLTSLNSHGIKVLPLKGPFLAAEAHADIGLRETADIDLLVHRADLQPAVAVLLELGYRPPADIRRSDGLPDLHFRMEHEQLPRVEMHWRLHWYENAFSADLLDRATASSDGLLRPAAEDLAAALLLFYARDGFHGVRLAADLAAWWDRRRHQLQPDFLQSYPALYPALAPALTAAARVAASITGVPSDSWLGAGSTTTRRVSLAVRLADWTQEGDRDQLRANISLVGGLLGPAKAFDAFVQRELLMGRGIERQTAIHAFKMTLRYLVALWRVRGGRIWTRQPGYRQQR